MSEGQMGISNKEGSLKIERLLVPSEAEVMVSYE
jgi:hypothetical protein